MAMHRLICGLGCVIALTATSAMAQYSNIEDPGFSSPSSSARPGPQYFDIGGRAFRNGDIKYAIDMYRVAASWGYKPAEYNLAVMYAKGQGVPVDMPRAMAWMTLAAERGDSNRYTEARNAIGRALSSTELDQADAVLRELAPTYADKVALRRAKARWKGELTSATGSRTGFIGNMVVGGNSSEGSSQRTPVDHPIGPASPLAKLSIPKGSSIWRAQTTLTKPGDPAGAGSTSSAPFDATGGHQIDASIAYRDLRESDDPYDPKFRIGTATVQPLIPVKDADDKGASPTESKKDRGN